MANYNGPLYDRACSVFQRRVKQVYFQLNPFLERTNVKDDEAESYQPSSKFVIPLKSIVVCEQFDSDHAKDWKVLNPDQFWDYLYSQSWGDDSSLRVLEGELLELLQMLLYKLEKNEDITSHNTFAYAKNERRVHKCYVNSEDKVEEYTDETLLIEFIYYGISSNRVVDERKKNNSIVNWKNYKETAAKAAGLSKLVDIADLLGNLNKTKKKQGGFLSLIRAPKSGSTVATDSKDARLEALTAMRWQDNLRNINSSKRRTFLTRPAVQPGTGYIFTDQDTIQSPLDIPQSTLMDNGSDLLAKMDEILFDKSKKVGRSRRTTTFFGGLVGRRLPPGDEFYINQLTPKHRQPFRVSDLLNKNKQAKMSEREMEIQEVKELSDWMMNSELRDHVEESRQNSDESYKPLLKVYDRRASFGEFYKYLEEENKFDPRFKKGSQRKKKNADKLKDKKDSKMAINGKKSLRINRSSVLSVSGKTSTAGDISFEDGMKIGTNGASRKIINDRQRFAKEVGGVTDSQAAKKHCLQNTFSAHKTDEDFGFSKVSSAFRGRRLNSMFSTNVPSCSRRRGDEPFYSVLPKITSPIQERVSRAESHSDKTFSTTGYNSPHSRVYSKRGNSKKSSTVESESDIESSDSTFDDEEDDFHDTVFDTKKINRKYSIEKIRAIKSKKDKKQPVLNILRKFCRVNTMLNALGPKPSKTPRKSIADATKAKHTAKAFGMFRRLNKKAQLEVKQLSEIGKMKVFEFLKHKDHKLSIPEVIFPNFQTCSIEDFKRNLKRAMGDFVIRKEMITSSFTFETVTTVTFTRPAAYVRMHQLPKDT